jgi:alkylation response protein AidB-like acyl-CoA dehydrogenase
MDFTPTDEQTLVRETARALLARRCPSSLVRAHADDPSVAGELWRDLREWTALADGPLVDLCVFLEETGAALAPGPFLVTTAFLGPLLRACRDDRFDALCAGELTGTVALEDGIAIEGTRVDVVALVVDGAVVWQRPADCKSLPTPDLTRTIASVPTAGLNEPTTALDHDAAMDLRERMTTALAVEMVGAARRMFEMTLAYAVAREQFGRPIASFQALKHRFADMKLLLERAWSAAYWAAMAIDAAAHERHRAVHVAKATAGETVRVLAREGVQIHGGIGFTWEHDMHLYVRRAYACEHLLGSTVWHRDRLADLLL